MESDIEILRKRLRFRAWHRGTREMDLILGSFADRHVPRMDHNALSEFEKFLEISDPELYDWYQKKVQVPENIDSPLMQKYLQHKLAS